MDTSRVDGVKAPQHRGTPRSYVEERPVVKSGHAMFWGHRVPFLRRFFRLVLLGVQDGLGVVGGLFSLTGPFEGRDRGRGLERVQVLFLPLGVVHALEGLRVLAAVQLKVEHVSFIILLELLV